MKVHGVFKRANKCQVPTSSSSGLLKDSQTSHRHFWLLAECIFLLISVTHRLRQTECIMSSYLVKSWLSVQKTFQMHQQSNNSSEFPKVFSERHSFLETFSLQKFPRTNKFAECCVPYVLFLRSHSTHQYIKDTERMYNSKGACLILFFKLT